MGNQNTHNTDNGMNEEKESMTSQTYHTYHRYGETNKECEHISSICDKHEDLKILQTKLAILELQTFKPVKYSNCCAHSKCNKKAPNNFIRSDVFICSNHLQETKQYFAALTKKYSVKDQIENLRKEGANTDKRTQIITAIFSSFTQVGASFNGSINIAADQPKYYWSLIMTKLLTVLQYLHRNVQIEGSKSIGAIQLIEALLKLMILYRYVMNPIGRDILNFITEISTHIISIISIGAIRTVDTMIRVVTDSVLFGYASSFIQGLATNYKNVAATASIVVGSSAIAAGGVMASSAVVGGSMASSGVVGGALVGSMAGIGALVGPPGIVIGAGIGFVTVGLIQLFHSTLSSKNANPIPAGNQILGISAQNIQALQQNNNYQQLQQQLQQLER